MGRVAVSVIALHIGGDMEVPHTPASAALAAEWRVIPLRFCTKDNTKVSIDRVTDIRRQASLKAGGLGCRYTCLVTAGDVQQAIYLYKDEDDWFLEDDV